MAEAIVHILGVLGDLVRGLFPGTLFRREADEEPEVPPES